MNIVSNRIYTASSCPALGIVHILGEISLTDYFPNVAQAMSPETLGNYQAKVGKRKLFVGAMFGTDPRDFEVLLVDKDGIVLTRSIINKYSETGEIILDNGFIGAEFDVSVLPRQAKYICMNRDGSWYWSVYEPMLLQPLEDTVPSPEDNILDWDFLALSGSPPDAHKKRKQEMFFGPIYDGYEPRFVGSYDKSLFQISAEAVEGIVPIPAKVVPEVKAEEPPITEPDPIAPETPVLADNEVITPPADQNAP